MPFHQTFPEIVYKTKIVDNFLNSEEINYLQQCPKPWGTQTSDNSNPKCLQFLISYPEVNDFYNHLFEKIKKEIGSYSCVRFYFNGQSYGMDGSFHVDHCDKTVLIYVSPYDKEWGGFTQIGKEIIAPVTGRMIIFDGMTPHKAFPFSRQTCPMRITLAFKLDENRNRKI